MYSELIHSNQSLLLSKLHKFEQHARFLEKKLKPFGITYMQAQEMIAYTYSFWSWSDLKEYVELSTDSISFFNNKNLNINSIYDTDIKKYREELLVLMNSEWENCIHKIKKMQLIPNTVLHSLSRKRLNDLLDTEIDDLYYRIHEGCELPQHDLSCIIANCDNSILTEIYDMQKHNFKNTRGFLYDYRFCLHFYYNIYFEDEGIKIIIRELDIYATPPSKTDILGNIYIKPWFVDYINGYVNHIISYLKKYNYSGRILLHCINNQECSSTTPSLTHPFDDISGIIELANKLYNNGAKNESLFGDSRTGIAIEF